MTVNNVNEHNKKYVTAVRCRRRGGMEGMQLRESLLTVELVWLKDGKLLQDITQHHAHWTPRKDVTDHAVHE